MGFPTLPKTGESVRDLRDAVRARAAALSRSGEDVLPEDSGDASSGPLAGISVTPAPSLAGLQSSTLRDMQSRAGEYGARNAGLVLPPGSAGAPQPAAHDLRLPGASPAGKLPSESAIASALHLARSRPVAPAATLARNATQTYAETSRRNADIQRAIVPSGESGTLPGEEQVTTRDTLRTLSPADQTALQRKFDTGGHAGTMSYDDWLSENFGELPPEERASQMRTSATATPKVQIGEDPTLPEGENSELAIGRRAAGKPLPEGREAKQYSQEQLRTMGRNVHNPDIPMTRFGGTFTHNPDGSLSARAPSPDLMAQADAIAKDQGDMSDSHVVALAQAFGIDAYKYGNDMDMLRADVTRERQRHEQRSKNYDAVPTGSGGFRYAPSDKFKERLALQDQSRLARTLQRRYQGVQGEANGQSAQQILSAIDAAAGTPEGKAEMVRLGQTLRRIREGNSAQAARNRAANYNISQDLRNPNQAPGMGVRSLMEAANTNNPLQMAAVYDIFGNPQAAMQNRQLAAAQATAAGKAIEGQTKAESDLAVAKIKAGEGEGDEDKLVGDMAGPQYTSALALTDPVQRYSTVEKIVRGMNPTLTPDDIANRTENIIASHLARVNGIQDPYVQNRLATLRGSKDKEKFIAFAMSSGAAANRQEAEYLFNNPTPPKSARDAGRQLAQGAAALGSNLVEGTTGFIGGMLGYPAPK